MPTYTYQCQSCENTQDFFHAISAKPRIKCEACGGQCRRLIGSGAGIIFKGSGFYETDYKTKTGKPAASGDDSKKESSSSGTDNKKESSSNSTDKKKKSSTKSEKSSSAT